MPLFSRNHDFQNVIYPQNLYNKYWLINMVVPDDYEAIIQWHPEMILVSKNPVTWQGFITASCNFNAGINIRIKLKLTVPNYPSLIDAEINFGKEITFIRNEEFNRRVKNLTNHATKVSIFLRQLQSLIGKFINTARIIENNEYETTNNKVKEMLQELQNVLETPSEVQLSSNNTLNTIKLSLGKVAIKLQKVKYGMHPWSVVYSDLPEIPALGPFEKNVSTLIVARNKFRLQVEILEKAWSNLKQIDENCWVMDPLQPKPCHLYRRIYLTPSLSMFIKIDPLNPMDLPEIKFMGSETEVESKRELISKNLQNWNLQYNFIDNLMMILNLNIFPKKEKKETVQDENTIVTDEECCICFSLEIDCNNLPDKICSNEKCRRRFHTSCLLQWLQAVAGNHIAFDHIHGTCPNCQENISCCIK
ncbi:E3 ubiquitin-protein ligase FANCL isoform X2 [Osmia bicornis bicornis]|uniref:E3 ubiquitin-protein ligase FANCL isoform X2 n=1 Tax=Osmia bicornis bicornis TaxID=1437191 RepID=UPI001EAF658F|nr:E3 ubiquitin-protein ligase FANCL isoform X2 [Osmia bicornis bicornis]